MAKKRKRTFGRKGRRGRPGKLASVPTVALQEELNRRVSAATDLARRRSQLGAELDEIDRELRAIGESVGGKRRVGRPPGRGRRRGRRGGPSLADVLQRALSGKTMSVGEATEAVRKAGYSSSSPHLRVMVNQQLISKRNADRFKRVSRGQYTAK